LNIADVSLSPNRDQARSSLFLHGVLLPRQWLCMAQQIQALYLTQHVSGSGCSVNMCDCQNAASHWIHLVKAPAAAAAAAAAEGAAVAAEGAAVAAGI
jgi:hypothetical protein